MTSPAVPSDIRRDLVALLPRLRRFALTLAGDLGAADRLVEESCARAIQKSHHWKGEGRLECWVFDLIRNTWSDKAHQHGAAFQIGDGSQESSTAGNGMLLDLPCDLSSALLLVDVENFGYEEAASILGISTELLAEHLCAARLQLASVPAALAERRA